MYCPHCGATLDPVARFCPSCGGALPLPVVKPATNPTSQAGLQPNTLSQTTIPTPLQQYPPAPTGGGYEPSWPAAHYTSSPPTNSGLPQLGSGGNHGLQPPARPPQWAKSAPRNFEGTVSNFHTRFEHELEPGSPGLAWNQKEGIKLQSQSRAQRTVNIWSFRVTRRDTHGNLLPPIQVEMRGHHIYGNLHDVDIVRVPRPWQAGKTVRTNKVYNVTTSSWVRVSRHKALVRRSVNSTTGIGMSLVAFYILQLDLSIQQIPHNSLPSQLQQFIDNPPQQLRDLISHVPQQLHSALFSIPPQFQGYIGPSLTPLTAICLGFMVIGIFITLYSIFGFKGGR